MENDDTLTEILNSLQVDDNGGGGAKMGEAVADDGHCYRSKVVRQISRDDLQAIQWCHAEGGFGVVGMPYIGPEDIAPKQQIMSYRSSEERVTALTHLKQAVSMHVAKTAPKLRAQQSVCALAQMFVRTGMFNPNEPTYSQSAIVKFPIPTGNTRVIARGSLSALSSIYREGYRYAKAGVIFKDISPAAIVQHDLFVSPDSDHSLLLIQTLDPISHRMAQRSVVFAPKARTLVPIPC